MFGKNSGSTSKKSGSANRTKANGHSKVEASQEVSNKNSHQVKGCSSPKASCSTRTGSAKTGSSKKSK